MSDTDYFANNLWFLQEIGDRLREDAAELERQAMVLRGRADAIDGAKVNLIRYRDSNGPEGGHDRG